MGWHGYTCELAHRGVKPTALGEAPGGERSNLAGQVGKCEMRHAREGEPVTDAKPATVTNVLWTSRAESDEVTHHGIHAQASYPRPTSARPLSCDARCPAWQPPRPRRATPLGSGSCRPRACRGGTSAYSRDEERRRYNCGCHERTHDHRPAPPCHAALTRLAAGLGCGAALPPLAASAALSWDILEVRLPEPRCGGRDAASPVSRSSIHSPPITNITIIPSHLIPQAS